ncbi:DsbA family protein [Candidatus Uhrbacteria bacterium]|nr:DsbA family protein [Candidatus Uhrbacteria bacterium]
MNKNHLWILLPLGLIGVFSITLLAANALPPKPVDKTAKKAEDLPPLSAPQVTIADPARGAATAKLLIVEFGDFGCSHCKEAENVLKEFLLAHPGEVRIVWKDFPIEQMNPGSREASEAARCAGRAGKFWEYHDALMNAPNLPREAELSGIADALGLNGQNFLACLGGDFTAPLIDRTFEEGLRLRINGVPYFFLNGQRFSGVINREALQAALSEALK